MTEILEKSQNIRLVDYLEKWDIFSDFEYRFRSSCQNATFLTVIVDRIARDWCLVWLVDNMFGA